jgi:hypothetical protein
MIICSICVRCFVSKRTPLEHMMIPLLWLSISWGCSVFHRFANFLSKLVLNICQNFLAVCSLILAPLFYLDQIASNNHASPSNSLQGHSHHSLLVGLFCWKTFDSCISILRNFSLLTSICNNNSFVFKVERVPGFQPHFFFFFFCVIVV